VKLSEDDRFLSRWARRKAQVRSGVDVSDAPGASSARGAAVVPVLPQVPLEPPEVSPGAADAPPDTEPQAPTLDDVAQLTRNSDFSRFVAPGVDGTVRNAAMKKLFSDPHFNVMDGLDIYIDDYGKPSPIPPAMLRLMRQSEFLGLFRDDKNEATETSAAGAYPAAAATPIDADPASPPPPAGRANAGTPERPPHEDSDLRLQPDDAAGHSGPDKGPGA
jgi:hypothetical protein